MKKIASFTVRMPIEKKNRLRRLAEQIWYERQSSLRRTRHYRSCRKRCISSLSGAIQERRRTGGACLTFENGSDRVQQKIRGTSWKRRSLTSSASGPFPIAQPRGSERHLRIVHFPLPKYAIFLPLREIWDKSETRTSLILDLCTPGIISVPIVIECLRVLRLPQFSFPCPAQITGPLCGHGPVPNIRS